MISCESSRRQEAEAAFAAADAALKDHKAFHASEIERLRLEHHINHADLRSQIDSLIEEKHYYSKKCDRYSFVVAILAIVCALLSIVSAAYIVWDLANSWAGFFR